MELKVYIDHAIEGAFYVKYLGTSDRNTLLWIDLSGTTYVYDKSPGGPPISVVAESFQKMMTYGPGKALAWLKNNTTLRGKMPTSQAKSKMKESNSSKKSVSEDVDQDGLNTILNNLASKHHIDAYSLSVAMEDAAPVTADAVKEVISEVAGEYVAARVNPQALSDIAYLYATGEYLEPVDAGDDDDISGGFDDDEDDKPHQGEFILA